VPAAQLKQINPVAEYLPVPQLPQSAEESDPVLATVLPAAQVVQTDNPVVAAYMPAAQSVQSAEEVEPVADKYFPVEQRMQVVFPVKIT